MDLPGIRKNIVFSLFFIVMPVVISGSIYLFFRTSDTVIYQVFQTLFSSNNLDYIRTFLQHNLTTTPGWCIYNLPGGLWVFAFANFCFLLLNKETKKYYKTILVLLLGIVISLEVFQMFNLTDGRFDTMDIVFYLIASLSSLLIGSIRIQKLKYQPILRSDKKPFYALGFTICLYCASIYLADVLIAQ